MEFIKSTFCLLIFVVCLKPSESEWSAEGRIGIRFYTENPTTYVQTPLESGISIFKNTHYNRYLPLVILIHGMDASVDCGFVEESVKAMYFKNVSKTFNIMALNLPELMAKQSFLDKYLYRTAMNSKLAGVAVGNFLNGIIDQGYTLPSRIHIVGYSMGAQVAGYLARHVKKVHGPIHVIIGLDPAGIGFTPNTFANWYTGLEHVKEEDAQFVHFLHCNSIGWGTQFYNATANFIFNGGNFQPGCATSQNLGCSHNRVPFYFIEGILYGEMFLAKKCGSLNLFSSCDCSSGEIRQVTFPPDLRARGSYFLNTNTATPFGRGEGGIKCNEQSQVIKKENEEDFSYAFTSPEIQETGKRKKYVHKTHHKKPKPKLPVYQHRTEEDYENQQSTLQEKQIHKTKSINEDIVSQPISKEEDVSLDTMLQKLHHSYFNK